MSCLATLKTLWISGLAFVNSMVAVMIKVLVIVADRIDCVTKPSETAQVTLASVAGLANATVTDLSAVSAIIAKSHRTLWELVTPSAPGRTQTILPSIPFSQDIN